MKLGYFSAFAFEEILNVVLQETCRRKFIVKLIPKARELVAFNNGEK